MQKANLQDIFLTKVRKQALSVTVFLMNGFQLRGTITGFDSFFPWCWTATAASSSSTSMPFSTIVPCAPSLQEEAGDNEQRDCRKIENTTPTVKYQKLRQDAETALSAP